MPNYRRALRPGGTYLFIVNLLQRQGNDLLTRHIELLRAIVPFAPCLVSQIRKLG